MGSFPESMKEYRNQLGKGAIQRAYQGLMEYMMDLRTHFQKKYPEHFVSGSIYQGYMDMTYFAFFPGSFKRRKLKVAIVFVHEAFRFEAWLAGANKPAQTKYWKMFKESGWDTYPLVPSVKGVDSILEHMLVGEPDFSDLEALTRQIERGTLKFIEEIEKILPPP